jgi:hypothetical protein
MTFTVQTKITVKYAQCVLKGYTDQLYSVLRVTGFIDFLRRPEFYITRKHKQILHRVLTSIFTPQMPLAVGL